MEKYIFIIKKDNETVGFGRTMAEVAEKIGSAISSVSRAIANDRPTREGFIIQKAARIVLFKNKQGQYSLRRATEPTEDWVSYLDITTNYYSGQFVRRQYDSDGVL